MLRKIRSLQAWLMLRFDALSASSTFVITLLALYSDVSPGLTAFLLIAASQCKHTRKKLDEAFWMLTASSHLDVTSTVSRIFRVSVPCFALISGFAIIPGGTGSEDGCLGTNIWVAKATLIVIFLACSLQTIWPASDGFRFCGKSGRVVAFRARTTRRCRSTSLVALLHR